MAIDGGGGGDFVFHAGWLILPIRLYFPFSISRKKIDGEKVSGDSGENDIGFSLHTVHVFADEPVLLSLINRLCLIKCTIFTIYQIGAPLHDISRLLSD